MKRDRKVLICMTDDEYAALDAMVAAYSVDGQAVTKSFLVRLGLRHLVKNSILISGVVHETC